MVQYIGVKENNSPLWYNFNLSIYCSAHNTMKYCVFIQQPIHHNMHIVENNKILTLNKHIKARPIYSSSGHVHCILSVLVAISQTSGQKYV